jgi:L-lactate dehydrogenase complex protein LldF
MKLMAAVLSSSRIYKLSGKAGRMVMRWWPGLVNNKWNPWFKNREMPEPPKKSFNEWYQLNKKP